MARNCLSIAVEVFDEMAGLVQFPVERARCLAAALGRNDDRLARCQQNYDALVGIEDFVGQQGIGLHMVAAHRCPADHGFGLGEKEAEWIARHGVPARYR